MISVRRLTAGEEDTANRIARIWYSGRGERLTYSAFLNEKMNHLLAGYVDGELAGFLIGYELRRLDTSQPMMMLYTIDVLPRFQQKGVGKRLVNELKRVCVRRGILKMFVITSESNQAAMALYSSTGGERESKDDVIFVYRSDRLEDMKLQC